MKKIKNGLLQKLFSLLSTEVRAVEITETTEYTYSRREFITKSAQTTAAVLIASSLPAFITSCAKQDDSNKQHSDEILDVAILGGGIAGLNCANHLLASHLKYKVFEADHRVGGRIITHLNDPLGMGIYPEFGGDFIDTSHEDMHSLAKEFQLEMLDMIQEQENNHWVKDIYFFNNRKISEKEIIQEFKKIAPTIAKDIQAIGANKDTPAAEKLDKLPLSDYIQSLKCATWLKEIFIAAWIAEYGLDCQELSTLDMLDMIETSTDKGFQVFGTSDERFRVKGGNIKIIDGLVKKIGEDKIAKNHEVSSIVEQEDGTYQIAFKNNSLIKAKTIVCTIPFTILRRIKLELKEMTTEMRTYIDELGYGKNTKLVLAYDGQPWRSKENNAMGYLFSHDITNGWDSSVNKPADSKNGGYVAFFGGDFSQKLSDVSTKNPLAPPSHSWRTQLPADKVEGFVNQLEQIFPQSKKKFLGKHIFVNWIEYPYAQASYSCYKVGQWTSFEKLKMKPIGHFYFAGEHCSKSFQGFMNGGAETGRLVAELVLKGEKLQVKTEKTNS